MRWLVDANGDLVNLDHILRIVTGGSGAEWFAAAKMSAGSDVQLEGIFATRVEAQSAARDLLDSIGD